MITTEFILLTVLGSILKVAKAIQDDEVTLLDFLAAIYAILMMVVCGIYYVVTGKGLFG